MQSIDVIQWVAFIILSLLMLGGALRVVTDSNLFHGALWLLVSLFGVAGLFVMLAAPFLAAVQVLVYMGAIVILIIFAIMLTQRVMGQEERPNQRWPIGLLMSGLAFLVTSLILLLAADSPLMSYAGALVPKPDAQSLLDLGKELVYPGTYSLPFIVASLLLTAAMVGSIVIAREDKS